LIPQSSRLGFKSIIHSVFCRLSPSRVILFAILAPHYLLLSLYHAILHLLAGAAIFTLDCHFLLPFYCEDINTLLLLSIITRQRHLQNDLLIAFSLEFG
ncbi:MAG: hypothetical protein MRQ11_05800, partial [Candidatus Midichloria mitochondrii]|nr:hypothetical protein [Candidatus Midichloria mitochondrii]